MYNYNDAIQNYETDCVNLPQAVKDKLRGHRDANRNRLKANIPTDIEVTDSHFISQGSMAINTTIQHPENDYDIDDGVWFFIEELVDAQGRALTAKEVQKMVCKALEDDRFNKAPEIHNNCVRVFYAEGHHVDVPCYRLTRAANGSAEKQELAGPTGWADSDPSEINCWFFGRVESLNKQRAEAGRQLRKLVRLTKRFARSRGEKWDTPNGLKLTMLVEECLPTHYERDDECFYYLLKALKNRLALSLEVENRAQTKWPKDKLTKTAQDDNMVELRTHVDEALKKLDVLHNLNCSRSDAKDAWEWVFQSDGYFDAYNEDTKKAHSLYEKRTLINAGIAVTSSSGVILGASSGVSQGVRNLPHKFYGDESA